MLLDTVLHDPQQMKPIQYELGLRQLVARKQLFELAPPKQAKLSCPILHCTMPRNHQTRCQQRVDDGRRVAVKQCGDLRDGAEFEFIGSSDADNPAATNLVSVGPKSCCPINSGGANHGLRYFGVADVAVIADPVGLDSIHKGLYYTSEIWRLPADKILDVVTWRVKMQTLSPPCPRMVHERFDRQEAMILDPLSVMSGQRPILFTTPDGLAVLQHTRTSARDFVARERTPGRIE